MPTQSESNMYWQNATDTFVGNPAYYQTVGAALVQHVLPHLDPADTVLDIGCGDGHFTAMVAPHVSSITAFDLSDSLIEQACERKLSNVEFRVGDILHGVGGEYDLVICMGVLVCVIDDRSFEQMLRVVATAVRPGGRLLLRETTSGWRPTTTTANGYPARYRRKASYLDVLESMSFSMSAERRLAVWHRLRRRENWLWLLQKADGR